MNYNHKFMKFISPIDVDIIERIFNGQKEGALKYKTINIEEIVIGSSST